ncbi:hypothetical protein B0H11DRAFT_1908233 [Mycena galericulata]|nr:hypothetical protein B0H11DRAFT_1908233 [Mycena galericulata]
MTVNKFQCTILGILGLDWGRRQDLRRTRGTFCEAGADGDTEKVKLAIELAKNAISDYPPENTVDADDLNTEVPRSNHVEGVSMAKTSQATFYRAISETRPGVDRIKTQIMLDITRYAVKNQCGKTPSDEEEPWNVHRAK